MRTIWAEASKLTKTIVRTSKDMFSENPFTRERDNVIRNFQEPPSPPTQRPIQRPLQPPKEQSESKMLSAGVLDIVKGNIDNFTKQITASSYTTAARNEEYMARWCGTTVNDNMYSGSTDFSASLKKEEFFDEAPLRQMLMRKYKWIEDVTEIRKLQYKPIQIHITVSPIHHTELMNPSVERIVREKLYEDLVPLVTCMYSIVTKDKPIVVFSPSHSETILEHFK